MKPKKKKKKTTIPKRRAQPRPRRLRLAKNWIATYTGKKLVSSYAKHFRVDLLCAIKELRLLGLSISEQYEQAVTKTLEALALQNKRKQLEKELEAMGIAECSDWDVDFIAGYTSGGAPYGLAGEDWEIIKVFSGVSF